MNEQIDINKMACGETIGTGSVVGTGWTLSLSSWSQQAADYPRCPPHVAWTTLSHASQLWTRRWS